MKEKKKKLTCKKCPYTWQPRLKDRLPVECPACKSRYWNKKKGE